MFHSNVNSIFYKVQMYIIGSFIKKNQSSRMYLWKNGHESFLQLIIRKILLAMTIITEKLI